MTRLIGCFATIALALVISGCASSSVDRPVAYVTSSGAARVEQYAPVFVVDDYHETHNRIGAPSARLTKSGKEHIYVDPDRPTVYAQAQPFTGLNGDYTNLIYRIHFEGTPWNALTAGRNVGLLIIVTLNDADEPVLLTTAHTCGCYRVNLPTTWLPPSQYPEGWECDEVDVHGEFLPGLLPWPNEQGEEYRFVVSIRGDTHRVRGVRVEHADEAAWRYEVVEAKMAPMCSLKVLPLEGTKETTSFFEASGRRKGYVKQSRKPWERLMMSWWAMDPYIGRDKALGDSEQTGTVLYTSLKPWKRRASDLWRFDEHLRCWGWGL